jgi:hypothetical protein
MNRLTTVAYTRRSPLDSAPTFGILIDGGDALKVYQALDNVLTAVRQAIPLPKGNELRGYVQDRQWPHMVIVPLVKWRLLAPTAWHISLRVLQSEESATGVKGWNQALKPIPADAQQQLNLRGWELPQLETAALMERHSTELYLLIGHLRDLLRLPELDNIGTEQAQEYITTLIRQQVSPSLEAVLEARSRFVRMLEEIAASSGQEHYPNLAALKDGLQLVYDAVLPNPDDEEGTTIRMGDIAAWAARLEKVREYVSAIYLLWATDVLAQVEA